MTVEAVAQVLQSSRGEPFGFVDDEELDIVREAGPAGPLVAFDVLVDADVDPRGAGGEVPVELAQGGGGAGCVEPGAGAGEPGVDRGVAVPARAPFLEQGFGGSQYA